MNERHAMRARPSRIAVVAITVAVVASVLGVGATGAQLARDAAPARGATPLAAPALAPCTLAAGVRTCELWAKADTATLVGAVSVPIWGYATSAGGDPSLPGPTIVALTGETLHVTLHNDLAEATSLTFPGQDGMVADTVGAGPTGMAEYEFEATEPGTFLYQAGLTDNGARQVAMGLYGALVIRPVAMPLTAYGTGDTTFFGERIVVISEVDPALNDAPTTYDMADYAPAYWLFNGKAYPDTEALGVAGGLATLFRYVNAGLENHSIGLLSLHQRIVGIDGSPLANPFEVSAQTIPAGGTLDAMVTPPAAGFTWDALWSAAGHLDNAGATTDGIVDFGGQLAFLDVFPAGPVITGLGAGPDPTPDFTVLFGVASDVASGGDNIAEAEWSLDVEAAPGGGEPMDALDGAFDEPVEAVGAGIDLTLASLGTHILYARARDAADVWGPASATTVTVENMFADGFETAALRWDAVVPTGGNVSVAGAAALRGSSGLQVVLTGKTPGFVRDDTPAGESSYRARFYFDPNGTLGGGHTIFVGRSTAAGVIFRVEARTQSNGTRHVRFTMRTASGTASSRWFAITDAAHAIGIAWDSGTSGSMSMRIDGVLVSTLTGNTNAFRLDEVRLGPSEGLKNGHRGTEYFDAFASDDSLSIGP